MMLLVIDIMMWVATLVSSDLTKSAVRACMRSAVIKISSFTAMQGRRPAAAGGGGRPKLSNPLLRACSSSAALTAAGLHTHVRTHRTSSDPAYLHTYVYLYMKREEEECCYFQTPGLKRVTVLLKTVTLKRIGFFCFPIKHSTHTLESGPKQDFRATV